MNFTYSYFIITFPETLTHLHHCATVKPVSHTGNDQIMSHHPNSQPL